MMKPFILITLLILVFSCKKKYEAPVPNSKWDVFNSTAASPLRTNMRNKMEGVYQVAEGADVFGTSTALKWSYTANGTDTTYHLSMYCEKPVVYIICEGKRLDSFIIFNGYWRNLINTETGIARFTITSTNGAKVIADTTSRLASPNITLNGTFGNGDDLPTLPVRLQYNRPLYSAKPLEIVAHRGRGPYL